MVSWLGARGLWGRGWGKLPHTEYVLLPTMFLNMKEIFKFPRCVKTLNKHAWETTHIPINKPILVIRRESTKNPGGSFFLPWRPESHQSVEPSLPTAGVSCPHPLSLSSLIGAVSTSSRRQTAADWILKSGLYLSSVPPRWGWEWE